MIPNTTESSNATDGRYLRNATKYSEKAQPDICRMQHLKRIVEQIEQSETWHLSQASQHTGQVPGNESIQQAWQS